MKTKFAKQITYWLGVAAIGLIVGVGIQFVRAWVEPTVAPPGGNIGAPITVGDSSQRKTGSLSIAGVFKTEDETILASDGGNVGVGVSDPVVKLDVNGGINSTGLVEAVMLKLKGSVAPACNSGNEGTFYFNSSSKKFFGCDGKGTWKELKFD